MDIDPLNIALARAAVAQAQFAFEEANDGLDRARDDSLAVEQAGKGLELASAALIAAETRLNAGARACEHDQISSRRIRTRSCRGNA